VGPSGATDSEERVSIFLVLIAFTDTHKAVGTLCRDCVSGPTEHVTSPCSAKEVGRAANPTRFSILIRREVLVEGSHGETGSFPCRCCDTEHERLYDEYESNQGDHFRMVLHLKFGQRLNRSLHSQCLCQLLEPTENGPVRVCLCMALKTRGSRVVNGIPCLVATPEPLEPPSARAWIMA